MNLPTVEETASSMGFVSWEEVNVSSDKGRREVHYYLKRIGGGSDLAVIGKEKSLRHMSYYYAIRNRSLLLSLKPPLKLKSRREVIDWLSSIVSELVIQKPSHPVRSPDSSDASELDFGKFREVQLQKLGKYTKEFSWLGLPWMCKKRRNHYRSFRRNGVKISVHDFVYVLAEENKRLVAYLEDMYEDSKGYNMVVVRWFHKIDEVGIVLPHNYNDREIFFSLCLQDLSVECIDGLASVLGPKHYAKFLRDAAHTRLSPFVCDKQFEDDDIKSFDITQVEGYWKQEIIKYMYSYPSVFKIRVNPQMPDDGQKVNGSVDDDDVTFTRPSKKHRLLKDNDVSAKDSAVAASGDATKLRNSFVDCKNGAGICSLRREPSTTEPRQDPLQHLKVGSEVEVLSQDSGIRGCWFRAVIIKKHKDKVKLRYQDINDADNEDKRLEEWILATRAAVPDQLGIRMYGRTIVRPVQQASKGSTSSVDVGAIVDVWWHDAWWEGIVIQKDSEDRIHVYLPGEKQESVFCRADMRSSQEWLGDQWKRIKERPNIARSLCSHSEINQVATKLESKPHDVAVDTAEVGKSESRLNESTLDIGSDDLKESGMVQDLSKDGTLSQLRWSTSKKRKRTGQKISSPEVGRANAFGRFLIPTAPFVDRENCKYMGDSLFGSAAVQPLTSLVMSR